MLPYLGNKTWASISREERLFCAELFYAVRGREGEFVAWLNGLRATGECRLDPSQDWELGFEVCFYRDVLKSAGMAVRETDFKDKRTFDLCLFSPTDIVIIEAKAHGKFQSDQNREFAADRTNIPRVLAMAGLADQAPRVSIVALASSVYFSNLSRVHRAIPAVFDGQFSWKDVDQSFQKHAAFRRADEVYSN